MCEDNSTAAVISTWPIQHSNSSPTRSVVTRKDPVKTIVMWTYDTHFDTFTTDRHSDHYCNLTTPGRCLLTSNRSLYDVSDFFCNLTTGRRCLFMASMKRVDIRQGSIRGRWIAVISCLPNSIRCPHYVCHCRLCHKKFEKNMKIIWKWKSIR